jgi:hypothetical protein
MRNHLHLVEGAGRGAVRRVSELEMTLRLYRTVTIVCLVLIAWTLA